MTDKLREAAQMALDALEWNLHTDLDNIPACTKWLNMANKTAEALRVALANEFNPDWDAMAVMVEEQQRMAKRIEELESALAQPEQEELGEIIPADEEQLNRIAKLVEQEPVAWNIKQNRPPLSSDNPTDVAAIAKREWQGLTEEERQECLYSDPIFGMAASTFARAIEAKLKEKNHG